MVAVRSVEDEHRRRICRERQSFVAERVRHINRVNRLLFAQGVGNYDPLRVNRRAQLEELTTGDGRPLPRHVKREIERELDRLELVMRQIKEVEREGDAMPDPQADTATEEYRRPAFNCSNCAASARRSPACFMPRHSSAASITVDRSPAMQDWRCRRGKVERWAGGKAYPRRATNGCA